MEKIILDSESYQRIKMMLISKDPENRKLALSCINEVDLDKSFAYILLLFKYQTKEERLDWLYYDDYPNIIVKLREWKIDAYTKLTHTQVIVINELLKIKDGKNKINSRNL